jgi:hypothetical protein
MYQSWLYEALTRCRHADEPKGPIASRRGLVAAERHRGRASGAVHAERSCALADTAFEVPDPDHLSGKMSVEVFDPEDPNTPVTIIETDDPWYILVKWELDGIVAPYVGGTFHVRAFLDDADGVAASSGQVGLTQNVPAGPFVGSLPRKYTARIDVAAGAVKPGLYQMVTSINYDNGKKLSLAAFAETGIMQFYEKEDA